MLNHYRLRLIDITTHSSGTWTLSSNDCHDNIHQLYLLSLILTERLNSKSMSFGMPSKQVKGAANSVSELPQGHTVSRKPFRPGKPEHL